MVITVEEKEKIKARKEKIGSYFLDLSKLAFASSVLGGLLPLLEKATLPSLVFVILGIIGTVSFVYIGNRILK